MRCNGQNTCTRPVSSHPRASSPEAGRGVVPPGAPSELSRSFSHLLGALAEEVVQLSLPPSLTKAVAKPKVMHHTWGQPTVTSP